MDRRQGFDPWQGQEILPIASVSRPALMLTHPSMKRVLEVISPGGKAQPVSDADHSSHLEPKSRMSRSCTFSPPPSGAHVSEYGK
jgi:hypothetical protein